MITCFTCARKIDGAFDAYNCTSCSAPMICCSDAYCKRRHERIVELAHPYCLRCAIAFEENAVRQRGIADRIDALTERAAEIALVRGTSVEHEIDSHVILV